MKRLVLSLATVVAFAPLGAQQATRSVTTADYDKAVRLLAPAVGSLVTGGSVAATWLPDGRMWYRTGAGNADFILIDPAKKSRVVCDAARSNCPGVPSTAEADAAGRGGRGGGRGGRGGGGGRGGAANNAVTSPDGTKAAFIRDWNLWVRDVASGQERQLTKDGEKDFGYATDNAGWASSERAILLWSPDSKKIATQQQDERKVGDMFLVETKVGHPTLKAWKYPLPGDSVVAMLHRVIIDVASGNIVRLQLAPEFHRATLGDNISMNDYNWSPDGSKLALVSTGRDHKNAILRVADAATGAVRTVFE